MPGLRRISTALVVAAASSSLDACGNATPSDAVGSVDQSDAVIAIATSGSDWVLYVCGGPTTYGTLTHWFSGHTAASADTIDGSDAGWVVHAQRISGAWSGSLVGPDGVTRTFAASATENATTDGLYGVVDQGCRTGVVISQAPGNGSVHVQGAWCDGQGGFQQVTPILPIEQTAQGIHVRVTLGANVRDLYVSRVAVPLR